MPPRDRAVPVSLLAVTFATLATSVVGCQTYRDQLDRADIHYRAARYEAALSNLEDLDDDWGHLDASERVRYEYIRGMTHARLSQRSDARHWLAIAREESSDHPNALTDEMRGLLARTLTEVDPVSGPDHEDVSTPPMTTGNQGATAMPGSTSGH